ncbi:MAG: ATP-dependent helicase HrpB [Cytophagaceae bacterium]|jgi:ATP-dependent helicase HrpB|nr:ATP-dependent helicase HrpB [Cytophagaceae bacterium]
MKRYGYPIDDVLEELLRTIQQHPITLLEAPPGAGKSTVVPLALLHHPILSQKKILLLEPRRVAAKSVAARLAANLEEAVGETVGYRIRQETKISSATKIEVVTEGVLTRMMQQDNSLDAYGILLLDEFHERSLHGDVALALGREIQQLLRDDLKMVVMSATLDTTTLSSLLQDAPVVRSEGKMYPITCHYIPPDKSLSFSDQTRKALRQILNEVPEGDILVFLPTIRDILLVSESLSHDLTDFAITPLYGELSLKEQEAALRPNPYGKRKIVLATSIAETSLTIEGIKVVLDTGFSRVTRFDPNAGLSRLVTERVTLDAAIQRAGRAGRLGPGIAYRLWPPAVQHQLLPNRTPEIVEADLCPLVLELALWGIPNVQQLSWITPPPIGNWNQAKDVLKRLGALDEAGKVTDKGKQLAQVSTHPRLANILIEAKKRSQLPLAADLVTVLDERDPFKQIRSVSIVERLLLLQQQRSQSRGVLDNTTFQRFEKTRSQWSSDNGRYTFHPDDVGNLLAMAFPERMAKRMDVSSRYKLAFGRTAVLPDQDTLATEEWIVIAAMDAGVGEGRVYLAAPFDPESMTHYVEEKETVHWDVQKEKIVAQKEWRIGHLLVKAQALSNVSEAKRQAVFLSLLQTDGKRWLQWDDTVLQWQARILSLKRWQEDYPWPDVTTEHLLETVEDWLSLYLTSIKRIEDILKLPLHDILMNTLSWEMQQKLAADAPTHIDVPSGSSIRIEYQQDGSAPVLSVRLQEVFGMADTPTVNQGKVKVLMHLLSPGYKPVQVTQDLKNFWNTTYSDVKKELKNRYPKHAWPDDPWTAVAVRGVKRKPTN